MTVMKVARKDFSDAVQSRALWALVGAFVVISLISSYAYAQVPEMFGEPAGATFDGLLFFTVGLLGLFIPVAAIIVCYKSLAGERESGSIKLLMSLPTTRGNVFFGKALGRSAVLLTGLGVGAIVGIGFGAVLIGEFRPVAAVVFFCLTAVFIAVYASIMVGISATTGSTSKATTFALGFFVIAELLWDVVPMGILYVVEGFSFPTEFPDWVFAMMQLSPSTAFLSSVTAALPGAADAAGEDPQMGVGVDAASDALFLSPEIGYLVLAFWIVVPLVVGYYRFNRADM